MTSLLPTVLAAVAVATAAVLAQQPEPLPPPATKFLAIAFEEVTERSFDRKDDKAKPATTETSQTTWGWGETR